MIPEWAFLRLQIFKCIVYVRAPFYETPCLISRPARPSRRPSDRATHEKCEHILVINAANVAPSQGVALLCLDAWLLPKVGVIKLD